MNVEESILKALVKKEIIDQKTADEIKLSAISYGKSITDLLLQKHLIDEDGLLSIKAEVFRTPLVTLTGRGISPELLNLIKEPVARKYKLIPFDMDKKNNRLKVAMTDPLDLPVIEFLEQKTGKSIEAYLAKESEITSKIDEEYSQGLAVEVSEALKETGEAKVKTVKASEIGKIIKEAPIAKIVSTILEYAMKSRASDIHIEPQENRTRVRYRIDGILHEKLALPRTVHDAVISRIKILCGMKIDERRVPQDGRFNFKIGDEEVDLRVSTLPTSHGEKIVMRLLKKTGGIPDLPELGLRGSALKTIQNAIVRPHGIILVTGPTGSGKTTTLYSILSRLNTNMVNIVTLEDPVEYEITGLSQVQVNPQAGLTFASGLRSFLRQDPNIILVGEIRDSDTTALAVQAALTGHLVFSTLHTNNASTAIPRLLDLGAEPFLIVSVLSAVQAQRIVRRICTACKEAYTPAPKIVEDVKSVLGNLLKTRELERTENGQPNIENSLPANDGENFHLYKGKGCNECNNTGYLGRIGIFEAIEISTAIGKMILERATAEEIENQAKKEGMITLKQDGYLKALDGITTLEEVLRVAQT